MPIHPRRSSGILIFATIAMLLPLAGACLASGKVVDSIERSFSVTGRPTLICRNIDGRTRITAGSAPTIQVKAVKEVVRAVSDEEGRRAAGKVEVRIEQIGNRVEVEVKHPMEWASLWRSAQVEVHLDILAPAASDLDANSVDGAIDVEGLQGRLDISTVDGSLTALACSGQLKVRTVDGAIRIDGAHGEIDATTVDGTQYLQGEFERLAAQSTDGSIEAHALPGSKMSSGWFISTTDGRIRLYLPEGFSADLEATAGEGSVSSDHPVAVAGSSSKHKLIGKMNSGGKTLRLRSSDGSIQILK